MVKIQHIQVMLLKDKFSVMSSEKKKKSNLKDNLKLKGKIHLPVYYDRCLNENDKKQTNHLFCLLFE